MHNLERWCIALRHSPWLARADWLWNRVRPSYNSALAFFGSNGLVRNINGTDPILVLPQCRGVTETYELEVWTRLMEQVLPGDIVADVGAFIGLYTIALAKRVGSSGRVVAFEPDPENFTSLKAHIELNGISDRVELIQAAVGGQDGALPCRGGKGCESHVSDQNGTQSVRCVRLDTVFADRPLDILKIDVEGYEEEVLKGAIKLLKDTRRTLRAIYIEVHPYAWAALGTSSESLIGLLREGGYRVFNLEMRPIKWIDNYGAIIALANETVR